MINLDGTTMYVSNTATNGVVDTATRLHFRQRGARVFARYGGGHVTRGVLAGRHEAGRLVYRYVQCERDGQIHAGRAVCDLEFHNGRIRIVEHFSWSTRGGSGVNVFDEVDDAPAA